ncbi:MAG: pirin family protein [Acidobacteria bacterium]|nr:pirin family protein [Acidobacteriota bacterium]
MTTIRKAEERGHADHGWLNTYHTFSFADYFDRKHMGFRTLRVINEDRVAPGMGFGAHGHENMEIISYVLSGALAHKDSMGHVETLRAGELQRMTAGTGIVHSEYNGSRSEPVHFLQIWIRPERAGLEPGYEQMKLDDVDKRGKLVLVAAPEGGAMKIHQDARVLIGQAEAGQELAYSLAPERGAWVHVIRGEATVNGNRLGAGDAAAVTEEEKIAIRGEAAESEVLVFDLA